MDHARKLAEDCDPTTPKQVHLRRAVSAAYYSLFHLLTSEATRLYIRDNSELAARFNRAINHNDIVNVSNKFAKKQWPKILGQKNENFELPEKLLQVAGAISELQEARHEADYDLSRTFSRNESLGFVNMADSAFAGWAEIQNTDAARFYLSCFLLWSVWDKQPRGKADQRGANFSMKTRMTGTEC